MKKNPRGLVPVFDLHLTGNTAANWGHKQADTECKVT